MAETYPSLGADEVEYGFATDLVAGAYYGYAKIIWGPDGSAYHIDVDNPLPVGGDLLSAIASSTDSIAGATLDRNTTPTASQTGFAGLFIRDDALSSIAGEVTEGNVTLGRVDVNGAIWMQLAGALSSLVDSVALGLPTGATRFQKQLRLTGSTGSTDLWTPNSGKKIAVTQFVASWQGSTAARLTVWQGANADTTLSDTEPFLFDHTLDASANGGAVLNFPLQTPWQTDTNDHELHVTLSATKTVWISVVGYEF